MDIEKFLPDLDVGESSRNRGLFELSYGQSRTESGECHYSSAVVEIELSSRIDESDKFVSAPCSSNF